MSESIFNQIGSVVKNELDLKVSHTDVLTSVSESNKVVTQIDIELIIDDTNTHKNKTWSSEKINEKLALIYAAL